MFGWLQMKHISKTLLLKIELISFTELDIKMIVYLLLHVLLSKWSCQLSANDTQTNLNQYQNNILEDV